MPVGEHIAKVCIAIELGTDIFNAEEQFQTVTHSNEETHAVDCHADVGDCLGKMIAKVMIGLLHDQSAIDKEAIFERLKTVVTKHLDLELQNTRSREEVANPAVEVSDDVLVQVKVHHACSIPGTRWCEPVNFVPANKIKNSRYSTVRRAWLTEAGHVHTGIVVNDWFHKFGCGETVSVPLSSLQVVMNGDCKQLGPVTIAWFWQADNSEHPNQKKD